MTHHLYIKNEYGVIWTIIPLINITGDIFMGREVIIENTIFIVNSYSREDATENLDELLGRVIINNAEQEFKKHPIINGDNPPKCFDYSSTES